MKTWNSIGIGVLLVCLCGCGPAPANRLHQPNVGFSYNLPKGWTQTRVIGLEFIIAATKSDNGMRPNIFVDFVTPATLLEVTANRFVEISSTNHHAYEMISKAPFEVDSGLPGIKIIARRQSKDQLSLATYQYVITDSKRTFAITCTCAEAVKEKYEPLFDASMRSLESKRMLPSGE